MARTLIRSTDLADSLISTAKIQDAAVTAAKVGTAAIGTSALQDGCTTEAKIGTGAVTSSKLGTGSVLAAAIGAGQVGTSALADGAITSAKLGSGSVLAAAIGSGQVGSDALASGAVTSAKIGTGAILAAAIGAGEVGTAALASGAVTSDKLGSASVTSSALAANSVGTSAVIDANITGAKLASAAVSPDKADLTAEWTFGAGKLKTSMAVSPADGDVVTKAYVDGVAQGANWKESVRAAQLDSTGVIDPLAVKDGDSYGGVTVATGDRILYFRSGANAAVGVYVVGASASYRAPDFDAPNEIKGAAVFVREGTNADTGYICTTDGAITVGTTALQFTQFTGLGQVTAGDALTKTGNTLNVVVNSAGGLQIVSDQLSVKTKTDSGLSVTSFGIAVGAGNGISVSGQSVAVSAKTNGGLLVDGTGVSVKTANGIQVDGSGFVSAKLNATNPALVADGNGLAVLVDAADAIETSGTGLKLKSASVSTAKIEDAAVSTAKIADGAITLAKLGSDVTAAIGKADHGMTFLATNGQTTFNLAHADAGAGFGGHQVYLNGRLQLIGSGNDYTFSDNTGPAGVDQIVFEFALTADDVVSVLYGRA